MRITFFKVEKPRHFSYQPVFYNEVNEQRKERERKIRSELGLPPMEGDENRSSEERIRGKFTAARNYSGNFDFKRKAQRTSNIRIMVIAGILVMLLYFMYYSNGLEKFMHFFKL